MRRVTYCDLATAKSYFGIEDTADDSRIGRLLDYATKRIDADTNRMFGAVTDTRSYTALYPDSLIVDDLLAVSALHTDDGSRDYATEWQTTDYELDPINTYPKWRVLVAPHGSHSFPLVSRGVRIAGTFGYGDGESSSPWTPSSMTLTVADETSTTVTLTGGELSYGQTIIVGSEQMYATGPTSVERGVNGTTASVHSAAPVRIARYPEAIVTATRILAARVLNMPSFGVRGAADLGTVESVSRYDPEYLWAIGPYRR